MNSHSSHSSHRGDAKRSNHLEKAKITAHISLYVNVPKSPFSD